MTFSTSTSLEPPHIPNASTARKPTRNGLQSVMAFWYAQHACHCIAHLVTRSAKSDRSSLTCGLKNNWALWTKGGMTGCTHSLKSMTWIQSLLTLNIWARQLNYIGRFYQQRPQATIRLLMRSKIRWNYRILRAGWAFNSSQFNLKKISQWIHKIQSLLMEA